MRVSTAVLCIVISLIAAQVFADEESSSSSSENCTMKRALCVLKPLNAMATFSAMLMFVGTLI